MTEDKEVVAESKKVRKKSMSQTQFPAYSLEQALRIPEAIFHFFASNPTTPDLVATSIQMSPTSGHFRMLTGASIAYGLTEGGYNSKKIQITHLAKRILWPNEVGEDVRAKREALLKPRITREFLTTYNGQKLPAKDFAINELIALGIPSDLSEKTLDLILDSARDVGIIRTINGQFFVDLHANIPSSDGRPISDIIQAISDDESQVIKHLGDQSSSNDTSQTSTLREDSNKPRVFIAHSKDHELIERLKELLLFGSMEPIVAIDQETSSEVLPHRMINIMRTCGAAIIHIDKERGVPTEQGITGATLQPNIMFEIGAAMALYGRRLILLIEDNVLLPSFLQSLHVVKCRDNKLDWDTTIKLLKVLTELKHHPVQ